MPNVLMMPRVSVKKGGAVQPTWWLCSMAQKCNPKQRSRSTTISPATSNLSAHLADTSSLGDFCATKSKYDCQLHWQFRRPNHQGLVDAMAGPHRPGCRGSHEA